MIVIDNIMPEADQLALEDLIINKTSWYFVKLKVKNEDNIVYENAVNTSQFVHTAFSDGKIMSDRFNDMVKVMFYFPKPVKDIIKIKANITMNSVHMSKDQYAIPHVDMERVGVKNYLTGVYYVNDCDGDTYIFNEQYDGIKKTKFTLKEKVSPKRGRLLLFDGSYYHAGNNPSGSDPRVVINYNYIFEG